MMQVLKSLHSTTTIEPDMRRIASAISSVADDLVGQRVEVLGRRRVDGMKPEARGQQLSRFVRRMRPVGEFLRAVNRDEHRPFPYSFVMTRLPRASTSPVYPRGTTTVVVAASMMAGAGTR